MRVYEFSKQYNIPVKDIISALQAEGVDIKSHMSIINDEAIALLERKFTNTAASEQSVVPENKVENQAQKAIEPVSTATSAVSTTAAPTNSYAGKDANKEVKMGGKKIDNESAAGKTAIDVKKITLKEMSVGEFSQITGVPVSDIILTL